jgi:hypothetical protein
VSKRIYLYQREDGKEFEAVEGSAYHWRLENSPNYKLIGEAEPEELFKVLRPRKPTKAFYQSKKIEGLDD